MLRAPTAKAYFKPELTKLFFKKVICSVTCKETLHHAAIPDNITNAITKNQLATYKFFSFCCGEWVNSQPPPN